MNETFSKYLAIGMLLGMMAGVLAYAMTDQVLFIEAGLAVGLIVGSGAGTLLSKRKK